MKAYLIDPIRRQVIPIEHNGTAEHIASLFEFYAPKFDVPVKVSRLNDLNDHITHNPQEPQARDDASCWHYYCAECIMPHCVFGPAIITGSIRGDKDSLADPMYSLRAYSEMVQWGYAEEKPAPEGIEFMGTVDEFLEWLEGSDGKSVQ